MSEEDIHAYLARNERKEMLRFLTCGSVDDGKSTLIGRLLHDTKGIYEDQLAAVQRDSLKHGTTGAGEVDLALLTDGLKAEREQGITIDVAYRYFSTARRKFIIADTPGHEQYTRNMATGASTCELAIILIDARYGVVTQTRRHSYIVNLLGIRHIVVAVNKMDLVGYDRGVFEKIKADYAAFAEKLRGGNGGQSGGTITFIPISALKGDNVVTKSAALGWYEGPTLLEQLETVDVVAARRAGGGGGGLRFPVQYVIRPNLDFRGFAGSIASGTVRQGDEVMVLPSGKKSRVKAIVTYEGEIAEASAPMAITVTLTDEVDVSRGDMLVHAETAPRLATQIEALVVWMAEQPLAGGKSYWIKQTTRTVGGELVELKHAVDVNTLEERAATRLGLNEVGRVVWSLSGPLAFDAYKDNPATGAFVIIDRLTNGTVGAGMIVGARERGQGYKGPVSVLEKQVRLGQHGAVVWARPGTAERLERELFERARTVVRVEDVRGGVVVEVARVVSAQGVIVIVAAEEGPSAAGREALGERLVETGEENVAGILRGLEGRGVIPTEEGREGEGI